MISIKGFSIQPRISLSQHLLITIKGFSIQPSISLSQHLLISIKGFSIQPSISTESTSADNNQKISTASDSLVLMHVHEDILDNADVKKNYAGVY